MSQRRPHRAPRCLDRIVGLMTFEKFPHASRITLFSKGLIGQKSAAYKPQGFGPCPLSAACPKPPPIAILLRTGDHKTLLYQVQTMEIRTPLD
jgi:hypothetical protein